MCLDRVMTIGQMRKESGLDLKDDCIIAYKVVKSHNKVALYNFSSQQYLMGCTIKRETKPGFMIQGHNLGSPPPKYESGIHLFLRRKGAEDYCYGAEIVVSVKFRRRSAIVWGYDCGQPVVVVKACVVW